MYSKWHISKTFVPKASTKQLTLRFYGGKYLDLMKDWELKVEEEA